MLDNPYQPPNSSSTQEIEGFAGPWAGFGVRLLAYVIDVLPITLGILALFFLFLGFDETFQRYTTARGDTNARIEFMAQRYQIRILSFLVYIIYCALLEGSAMQGTFGKRLLGLRVTDENGNRLSMGRSYAGICNVSVAVLANARLEQGLDGATRVELVGSLQAVVQQLRRRYA